MSVSIEFDFVSNLDQLKKDALVVEVSRAYAEIRRLKALYTIGDVLKQQHAIIEKIVKNTSDIVEGLPAKLDGICSRISVLPDLISKKVKTYAEAAKIPSEFIATPEKQVVLTQVAIREEKDRPIREKRCVLKHIPVGANPDDILSIICAKAEIAKDAVTMVPLGKSKTPVAFLITTPSGAAATKFRSSVSSLRRETPERFPAMSARPDYSPTEEAVFRQEWAKAFSLNNEAGKMVWVVRDLKLVELKTPLEWSKKDLKKNISD